MNKGFFTPISSMGLIVFGVIVFSFQLVFNFLFPVIALNFKDIFKIHGFVFFITFIVITITNQITNKFPDKTGFVYLGFVLFKIAVSSFFLYPYFSLEAFQAKMVVLTFFIVFLVYIVFEATSVINYLNQKQNN